MIVFSVSQKISKEMSESAIQNLSESLDLLQSTIEAILRSEAEFQSLIAQEIARAEGLYMQKYCGCVFSEEDRYAKQIHKDKLT